jgi:hypothetical protein
LMFSTFHIQHVVLHVKIWYIFSFVCYIWLINCIWGIF